ncbi:hypothetical protein [Sphingomonas aquatilis]
MTDATITTATNTKPISNGDFLLWRKSGQTMKNAVVAAARAGTRNPRFRHPTYEAAEAEAQRLLQQMPESTFIILQEVGRVKVDAERKLPE